MEEKHEMIWLDVLNEVFEKGRWTFPLLSERVLEDFDSKISPDALAKKFRGALKFKVEELAYVCRVLETHPNYILGWSEDPHQSIPDFFDKRLSFLVNNMSDAELDLWLRQGEEVLVKDDD